MDKSKELYTYNNMNENNENNQYILARILIHRSKEFVEAQHSIFDLHGIRYKGHGKYPLHE